MRLVSKVVGTTYRPHVDFGSMRPGDPIELVWEPTNPEGPRYVDQRAQAIACWHRGYKIGYLRASEGAPAGQVCGAMVLAGRHSGTCNGVAHAEITEITGGGAKLHGINIHVHIHERNPMTTFKIQDGHAIKNPDGSITLYQGAGALVSCIVLAAFELVQLTGGQVAAAPAVVPTAPAAGTTPPPAAIPTAPAATGTLAPAGPPPNAAAWCIATEALAPDTVLDLEQRKAMGAALKADGLDTAAIKALLLKAIGKEASEGITAGQAAAMVRTVAIPF